MFGSNVFYNNRCFCLCVFEKNQKEWFFLSETLPAGYVVFSCVVALGRQILLEVSCRGWYKLKGIFRRHDFFWIF